MISFESRVEARGRGGHVIPLPPGLDPRASFGAVRARVLVRVGGAELRTTLMRYGGVDYIGITQANLAAAGVAAGDAVSVEIELDPTPREVELPPALAAALATAPELRAYYDSLSFTHRREYAEWIASAKREETRASRVEKTIELLGARVRHP